MTKVLQYSKFKLYAMILHNFIYNIFLFFGNFFLCSIFFCFLQNCIIVFTKVYVNEMWQPMHNIPYILQYIEYAFFSRVFLLQQLNRSHRSWKITIEVNICCSCKGNRSIICAMVARRKCHSHGERRMLFAVRIDWISR